LFLPSLAVDARVTTKTALLTTGWQGALEVIAVRLVAASLKWSLIGRKIKATPTITTIILCERK
jgi:hypothetical protein